ncbi:MAG: cadmium resistance transporter [Bdellovibrionia bacterium]
MIDENVTYEFLKTITLGLVTFATTNIDDFLLILLFFSQGISTQKIVIGQYLGMLGIFVLSYLVGSAMLFFLTPQWIGSLGIIPLVIGLRELYQRFRPNSNWRGHALSQKGRTVGATISKASVAKEHPSKIGTFTIAIMTLANGSDNIAVYSSLFAEKAKFDIFLLIAVYLILTGAWCIGGYIIASGRKWSKAVNHFGKIVLPYTLIAIGFSIFFKLI